MTRDSQSFGIEMRRGARRGGRAACLGLAIWVASSGCLIPSQPDWGIALDEDEIQSALEGLPEEAKAALLPLTRVFYGKIRSRRFNSRATFEDPSIRQFFPDVTAYSDYYAGLVDAIDRAHIANNRPNVIELLSIDRNPSGSIRLGLRFVGDNDLPLRWWSASLLREDEWRWHEGRWWVVPGKV